MILFHKLDAIRTLIFVLLTLVGPAAAADEVESGQGQAAVDTSDIVASLNRCGGDQRSMTFCAQDHARAVMPMLEAAASQVRSIFDRRSDQLAFDQAQKAFINYVEAACSLDGQLYSPGSMAGESNDRCVVRRVARRIKALDDYADCKSGRIGCQGGATLTDAELGEIIQ